MYERNVCQGLILEEVVDLALGLRQLVIISIEGSLETRWDHLDVDGIPENTFLSILKQNRVFAFFCLRHLVIEWEKNFIGDFAAPYRLHQDSLDWSFVKLFDFFGEGARRCYPRWHQLFFYELSLGNHYNGRKFLLLLFCCCLSHDAMLSLFTFKI